MAQTTPVGFHLRVNAWVAVHLAGRRLQDLGAIPTRATHDKTVHRHATRSRFEPSELEKVVQPIHSGFERFDRIVLRQHISELLPPNPTSDEIILQTW
jgi:hypothetical protein